jgi:hypothetical protein
LKEICGHYSKQNISIKNEYTFEDIKEEQGLLNMNKVIAFLQDFEISVNPKVIHYRTQNYNCRKWQSCTKRHAINEA